MSVRRLPVLGSVSHACSLDYGYQDKQGKK